MPTCSTKYQGEIEYSEDAVLNFAWGPFGFEAETRFVLIEVPPARPIVFLQSLATPGLCFVALPVFVVDPAYRLSLAPEDLSALELPANRQPRIGEEVLCLVLITVQKNRPTTANLMAPVVVNLGSRNALQTLAFEVNYSHQHEFLQPEEDAVCS
ncbi:Flagellar assembly factor FliW [Candidatus Sulfopaludibacter sp. SbA3]|nr:Flagellar assembly factor FliW [Candidatus Sulfopaludibacter sp. SbA3]